MQVTLIETSEMPDDIAEMLRDGGAFMKDGTADYVVGFWEHELRNEAKESVEDVQKLDAWLKERGAQDRERVLIHHGKFDRFPAYLFGSLGGD